MDKNTLLKVTQEDNELCFNFQGSRSDIFRVVGAILEGLHYTDIKKGECVLESKLEIEYKVRQAMKEAFEKARTKVMKEAKNE